MLRKWIVYLGLLFVSTVAYGAEKIPCVVMSHGIKVTTAEGLPKIGRVKIDDCTGLKAASEPAEVCYSTKSRIPDCKRLGNSPIDWLALQASNLMPASVERVFAALVGEQRGSIGLRKANDPVRKQGFPYNEILPRSDHLVIVSDEVRQVDYFVLTAEGRASAPIFRVQSTTLPLRVPGTALLMGQAYSWRARSGGEEFTGGFKVASNDIAQRVTARVKEIQARNEISKEARLFLEAQVYEAYGLPFERDLVLAEISR